MSRNKEKNNQAKLLKAKTIKAKARESAKVRANKIDSFAISATKRIGSPASLGVHTLLFSGVWTLHLFGVPFDTIMLGLTTIVSLEAIYLALFIQMSVNRQAEEIDEIQEDLDEIQEDIDEIQEDVEEIQEDVGEIQEDVEEIQEDVDEIQEDVEEIHDLEEGAVTKPTDTHTGNVENTIRQIEQLLSELRQLKK